MDENLKKILTTLGIQDGEYYINGNGRVMKKGLFSDSFTGIYKDKNGVFKKEGFLWDSDTGLYQNKHGEFKEEGTFFDSDTGIYQDKGGNYRKKGLFVDEKTGYYQDKRGNIKQESFWGSRDRISTSSSSAEQDGFSAILYLVFFAMFAMAIAILLFVAVMIVFVALLLSPAVLLVWYLIKKREFKWTAITGMVISAYLAWDFATNGLVDRNILETANDISKYVSISYAVLFFTTLGFYLDKYASSKIPVLANGNFIERKNTNERRYIIAGICLLMTLAFSSYQFIGSAGQNYFNLTNDEIDYSQNIRSLVEAEDARNLDLALSHYAGYIQQYWEKFGITNDELKKQYQNAWSKTSYSQNTIQNIEKVNDNTYNLTTIFNFRTVKNNELKQVQSKVQFVFDSNGKIIKSYRIE